MTKIQNKDKSREYVCFWCCKSRKPKKLYINNEHEMIKILKNVDVR